MFNEELGELIEGISEVNVDVNSLKGQEVDEVMVDFYRKRFSMFHDEGAPKAIDAYLQKMLHDKSINDATRIAIGLEALKF